MPPTTASLLTSDEVAELLKVSRRSVERLVEAGKLPTVKVGRLVRFRREDVEAFIEDGAA